MTGMVKLIGIIAFLSIIGLSVLACESDADTTSKFEGTWRHFNPIAENATFVFSGNSFTYTWDGGARSGTFTYTDTNIVITATDGTSWSTTYILTATQTTTPNFQAGTPMIVLDEAGRVGNWWFFGGYIKQ
jgi:hypothetical protein